jgi:hypothetical protein
MIVAGKVIVFCAQIEYAIEQITFSKTIQGKDAE